MYITRTKIFLLNIVSETNRVQLFNSLNIKICNLIINSFCKRDKIKYVPIYLCV